MLLQVNNLKTYFNTKDGAARAVDDVSFSINRGETFALVGESGCGKSMTALSIIQLVPKPAGFHAGGSILLGGKDLLRLPEAEKRSIRGRKISMIFQEPMTSLNPVFTIGYQLMEPILLHQNVTKKEAKQRALSLLGQVNIPDPKQRFNEYPHQLSGGMKQRVMIAIAMACEPDLLIADEPTTALDVTIQAQILELMKALQEKKGTAILLITHNLAVVAETADRVAVMYAGRIVETASRETILNNPSHPYTVKLMQSMPRQENKALTLQTIEGRVPPATAYPDGCRFAARCHMAKALCKQTDPQLIALDEEHQAACILYDPQHELSATAEEVRARLKPEARLEHPASEEIYLDVGDLKVHFPIKKGVFKRTVGHVKAVDGVDLKIRRGKTLALVGESGCGKTTFGKALLQLIPPTAGRVVVQSRDLIGLSSRDLQPYRKQMQIIFQDPYSALNPRMMIGEIIMEGMSANGIGDSRQDRERKISEILPRVGLDPDMIHRYPHEFSGGQRQRIGIARCLAVDPNFIVCDEATSALDVSVQAQILNLLEKLQHDLGLTYLFITHDLGVVEYLADEVAVMYLGRIVERGTTDDIFKNAKHPYTQALLSAVPKLDPASGVEKIRLSGDVPSPINPPTGCHFNPRCNEVHERCKGAYPANFELSETHSARCFLYEPSKTE